jgi:hypothetical protein
MEEVFQKPISGLTDSLKPSYSAFRAWLRVPHLTDELVQQGGTVSAHDPQVQAIQLLMQREFEIYYSCVEVPSLWDRLLRYFGHAGGVLRTSAVDELESKKEPKEANCKR